MTIETAETITITIEEYNSLRRAEIVLAALEAGGVDNWEWYGDAMTDEICKELEKFQ